MRARQTLRSGMAVMLLATAAACMAPQPKLAATPASQVPLEASIFPPYYGQVPFRVNKPAHVALFEILPGRGVSLLYPNGGSGFTQVADNWVPMQYNAQRWLYRSDNVATVGSSQWSGFDYGYGMGFGPVGMRDMNRTSAPRYLFLIASEEPIEISQFQHNLASVRQFLGPNQYSSFQPYNIMEKLAYAVVPYANDETWVTDVFVDWGYDWGYGYSPGMAATSASWVAMRCADGSVGMARYIPGWGYDLMTCTPWASNQETPSPGDSTASPGQNEEGRGRAGASAEDAEGRGRTGGASSARLRLQAPEQSAETRSRIAQLREDASRAQFNALLNQQLRQNVELRHRADEMLGRGPGGSMGSSANSNAGRSSASGNSPRSRASGGDSRANAGRSGTQTSQPRSRSGGTEPPRTSTQSPAPVSSPPPRSREPSSSPPTTPPPASSPRSRPPV